MFYCKRTEETKRLSSEGKKVDHEKTAKGKLLLQFPLRL